MSSNDNGNVFLFGGIGSDGTPLSDLWRWDGTNWIDLAAAYVCPARCQASMVSTANGVWVFGGYDPLTNQDFGDSWGWSPSSGWGTGSSSGGPPARRAARATRIVGGDIVVHGGESGGTVFADTWLRSFNGWTQLNSAGGPALTSAGFGYDPDTRQAFLAGGHNANGFVADAWRFDGNSWVPLTTNGQPTPVRDAAFALDSTRHRVLVVGGETATGTIDEHWEYGSTYPVRHFGAGCASTGAVPSLSIGAASIGKILHYSIYGNGPLRSVATAFGFSDTTWNGIPLPIPLSAFGLACDLLIEPAVITSWFTSSVNTHVYGDSIQIPNDPGLVGLSLFVQSSVFDINGSHGVTDAVEIVVF